MFNERLEFLFTRQQTTRLNAAELGELHDLLADPANEQQVATLLQKEWGGHAPADKLLTSSESKSVFAQILERVSIKQKTASRSFFMQLWKVAASVLIIAGVAAAYFLINSDSGLPEIAKMNQVSTQPGSKSKLQLADGTQVWLHANSRLVYNGENFGKINREVTLIGEAYFDVVKNAKVPFIIHTGQVNITVKGTAFNVKAYPGDKAVETTLIRGLIEIATIQDPDRKILLKPNEKILIPVINSSQQVKTPAKDSTRSLFSITRLQPGKEMPAEAAWINTQLVFDDEPLSSIAPKMASWYNIDIQFEDEEIKKRRFSGTIERETLKETLEALQLSYPFTYQISENTLYVRTKK